MRRSKPYRPPKLNMHRFSLSWYRNLNRPKPSRNPPFVTSSSKRAPGSRQVESGHFRLLSWLGATRPSKFDVGVLFLLDGRVERHDPMTEVPAIRDRKMPQRGGDARLHHARANRPTHGAKPGDNLKQLVAVVRADYALTQSRLTGARRNYFRPHLLKNSFIRRETRRSRL